MALLSKPIRLLLIALFVGWSANILFWDTWLGLSVPLFVLLLLGALWQTLKQGRTQFLRQNVWLILPLLFFAFMVMVRDSPLLSGLNIVATLYLLSLVATFATADDATRPGFIEFGAIPLRAGIGTFFLPFPFVRDTVHFNSIHARSQQTVYPVLRGVLIATPIFVVFLGLLLSADAVFASTLGRLFTWEGSLSLPVRAVFSLIVAWLAIGWLLYSVRQEPSLLRPIPYRFLLSVRQHVSLGAKEAVTILLSLNLLFGSFVIIQFAYLFGGLQQVTLNGLSYAEYARRGFFELILVSILTVGVILCLHWFTERTSKRQTAVFNMLSAIMVAFVVVMLTSAFRRLSLYELQFGFTETRLYVHVFMIWLAILLVWFAVALWLQPKRLAIGALAVGIGFLVTMNLINPDAFVVRQNMDRFHLLGYLDVDYLTTLSNDAVPELLMVYAEISSLEEVTHADQCRTSSYSSRMTEVEYSAGETPKFCFETRDPNYLENHLKERRRSLLQSEEMWQWQAFQIGRWRAYRALQEGV